MIINQYSVKRKILAYRETLQQSKMIGARFQSRLCFCRDLERYLDAVFFRKTNIR
jgi:hypothetical protein